MRLYRCFLVVLLIMVIGFGVWYCVSVFDEEKTSMDGTLVFGGGAYAADYSIY